MADDWEADDWEAEDFKPQLPATTTAAAANLEQTAGAALLAKVAEPDMSKFEDEDNEEPEETREHTIKPQPKKKVEKKYAMRGEVVDDDTPLDDPIAERLRKQRLEEEADMRAGVFGESGAASAAKLAAMLPKSVKDFEEYADLVVKSFVAPHAANKNYKAFLKALLRAAAAPLSAEDAKEIENAAAAVRADKVKEEKAALAAKKTTKKSVNVGRGGGTAGLDDYIYDDAGAGDDFDFM